MDWVVDQNAIAMIVQMLRTTKKEKWLSMLSLTGIQMLLNQRLNRKGSMLRDVIARNRDVKRNIVNVTRVEFPAPIYVFVKDAKTVMERNKGSFPSSSTTIMRT